MPRRRATSCNSTRAPSITSQPHGHRCTRSGRKRAARAAGDNDRDVFPGRRRRRRFLSWSVLAQRLYLQPRADRPGLPPRPMPHPCGRPTCTGPDRTARQVARRCPPDGKRVTMNKLIAVMFCGLLAVPVCAQEKVDVQKLQTQAQEAVQSEQWDVAAAAFKKLTEAEPKEGRNWHMLGYTLHAAGKLDEALKVHLKAAEFPEVAPVATYNAACVYALKGDKDKAFELLGKAIERGFAQPGQLDQDSDMDSLRADPRFKDIVAQTKKKAEAGGGRGQVQVFAPLTKRMGQRVAFFGGGGAPP